MREGKRNAKEEWKIILRDATFLESAACSFASSVYIIFYPEDGAASTFLQSTGSHLSPQKRYSSQSPPLKPQIPFLHGMSEMKQLSGACGRT
jgi:hypothetical protein